MRSLAFLFALSLSFSSEIKLSTTQSVFCSIEHSDIYFHLQSSQLSKTDNFSYGAQWWPSNNLYLTGLFSNLTIENSIYIKDGKKIEQTKQIVISNYSDASKQKQFWSIAKT